MNSDELALLYNLRIIEMILNDIYDRSDIIKDLTILNEIEEIYNCIHFLNELLQKRAKGNE